MPNFPLPANHHAETLTPYSPAAVGHVCAITGETLRPGDEVVVCDAVPGRDPISVEGWATLGSCPHCGAGTGLVAAYVPPIWAGSPGWAAPAAPPAGDRSPALVGGLLGLFLLAAAAIAVAVFLFVVRTRGGDAEPTALPLAALTATSGAATVGLSATEAAHSAATAAAAATATPLVIIVATPTTPPTAAAPTPIPTIAPPTPPPDSPITALVLVNPANERAIRALRADDTIDLSQIGRDTLTVRAEVESSAVESVLFLLDGETFCAHGNCVENAPPYYMGGDQGGDAYDDWDWSQMLGTHTLTAIACTGDGGTGGCFPPIDVRLTISR